MNVDVSTPLTQEERNYLSERGLYAEIERADGLSGTESPELPAGDGTGLRLAPLNTAEARAARAEQLRRELAELEGTDAASESAEEDSYEDWKLEDLKAEIDTRNDGRPADQKLSKTGTKQDLVDRLYADDELSS
jgi:hypothetical protein